MIEQGFCVFAQQNAQVDYVRQAHALAMSIKTHMPHSKVCLITNVNITKTVSSVFDHVVDIPGMDEAVDQDWKIQNRYKIYTATPFKHSIILDADMLVLNDISHWWKFLKNYKMYFTSAVKNYRDEFNHSDHYRKTFTSNGLPNLYCGVHYYQRCKENDQFVELLRDIVRNHTLFYDKFTPKHTQKWCSMDVSVALASKLLGITEKITSRVPYVTFTHMKPHLQDWKTVPDHWMKKVNVYHNMGGHIKIDNFRQRGVLHYVENEFLTDELFATIEKNYYESNQ